MSDTVTKRKRIEPIPCPYCGGTRLIVYSRDYKTPAGSSLREFWRISCDSCDANGPQADTRSKAMMLWNTRHGGADHERRDTTDC